jgi:hypothetical protein
MGEIQRNLGTVLLLAGMLVLSVLQPHEMQTVCSVNVLLEVTYVLI